jgi:glycosyltransferase involved in cell wall biosynthesis
MRIALYCPSKPLDHPQPSGDLTIAQGLHQFFNQTGNECREVVAFRSRWFWHSVSGWISALRCIVRGLRLAKDFRPDVWLTYHSYYKSPDLIGPFVCRLLDIPYFQLEPMYATKWRKRSGTRTGFYLNRMALKSAECVFVNNLSDVAALRRILPEDRIAFIPPGIFPEEFRRDEAGGERVRTQFGIAVNTPLILTAAMFRPGAKWESLAYLLTSLAILQQRRNDFRVMIVGGGPLQSQLEKMADDLIPGKTIFTGTVPRRQMLSFYSAADIFAFPGIRESIGMVYLEAQSCGLPVVALDMGGAAQMVQNGRTGLLVPQDGGDATADAIEKLLDDPILRKNLGEQGQEYARKERNLRCNYLVILQKFEETIDPAPAPA